jgi:hypothetical protein
LQLIEEAADLRPVETDLRCPLAELMGLKKCRHGRRDTGQH